MHVVVCGAERSDLAVGAGFLAFDAVIGCKEHLATDMVAVRATGPMKKLMRVLEEFSPSSEGFSIGYPSHRQMSAALRAFLDMVRDTHRSPGPAVTNPLQEESGR
jgi:DNA-binding transcriptional LysR family regulator